MKKEQRALFEGLRDKDPYFIGEGEEVVKALLKSKIQVISILMEERYISKIEISPSIKIELASKEELKKITGYEMHQGIRALGIKPENIAIHQIDGSAVVLNGVINAENVGAIIRNAVAFGIRNLIVDSLNVAVASGIVFYENSRASGGRFDR